MMVLKHNNQERWLNENRHLSLFVWLLTGCLKAAFLAAFKRAEELSSSLSPTDQNNQLQLPHTTDQKSQESQESLKSLKSQESQIPSLTVDPPRLLAEALLKIRPTTTVAPSSLPTSFNFLHSASMVDMAYRSSRLSREGGLGSGSMEAGEASETDYSTPTLERHVTTIRRSLVIPESKTSTSSSKNRPTMPRHMDSLSGDAITPAIRPQGKSKDLAGDAEADNLLNEVLAKLVDLSKRDELDRISEFGKDRKRKLKGQRSFHNLPLRRCQLDVREIQMLQEVADCLRNSRISGVCSLAVKYSFGSFAEAILAGTEDGEVSRFFVVP